VQREIDVRKRFQSVLISSNSKLRQIAIGLFGEHWFYELGYYYLLTRPDFRKSVGELRQMKNRHKGERCFIVGNGPSLCQMDLSPLVDEITFGLNRIYLMFPKIDWVPSYYVSVNKLVVKQFAEEILANVPTLKFISYDARRWIRHASKVVFLYSRNGPRFYTDISEGIWQGATVTYTAMQIAYYMGFRQVILIGVDHSYNTAGKPHETVISTGDDRDHFDGGYFGKGSRWQIPDLELSESAYQLAKVRYEQDGREIINATVGGKLEVFPRVEYGTLFK
jgi:hypothetical protein